MAARPALSAARTVSVLNFLAAHPTQSFTLSELSRRLDINPASLHAVLTELTAAGYLARHPTHKTYRLGPAMVALGHAALEAHGVVDLARDEMRRLAEELDLECEASVTIGDEIVVLARAGLPIPAWEGPAVGQRLPLVAPVGAVFMAQAAEDEIAAWLDRSPVATARERRRFRRYLDAVRRRGWSVTLRVRAERPVGRALTRLADEPGAASARDSLAALVGELGHEEHQLLDIDPAATYTVTSIAAPVFGPEGEVVIALAALGFRRTLTGVDVRHLGTRVAEAADLVTKATHGRRPRR